MVNLENLFDEEDRSRRTRNSQMTVQQIEQLQRALSEAFRW
jgi:hypothetical protein